MDKRIKDFIAAQTVLTFCTSYRNEPYCANCMYTSFEDSDMLIFCSDGKTKHIVDALLNSKIAGTILPDKQLTGKIKGIQFTGTFTSPSGSLLEKAEEKYYSKFPFARLMKGQVWIIRLTYVKLVDNTLGIGTKILWRLPAEHEI